MRIVFTGPAEGVTILATGQLAAAGVPLEVDDELADRLLEQDVWVAAGNGISESSTRAEVAKACRAAGLSTKGSKGELLERLDAHHQAAAEAPADTDHTDDPAASGQEG